MAYQLAILDASETENVSIYNAFDTVAEFGNAETFAVRVHTHLVLSNLGSSAATITVVARIAAEGDVWSTTLLKRVASDSVVHLMIPPIYVRPGDTLEILAFSTSSGDADVTTLATFYDAGLVGADVRRWGADEVLGGVSGAPQVRVITVGGAAIGSSSFAAGAINAAAIAASALNGKGDWLTAGGYTAPDNAGISTLLGRLTSDRAGKLDNLDVQLSTRLAAADYAAPLDAAGVAAAVLDAQADDHAEAGSIGEAIAAGGSGGGAGPGDGDTAVNHNTGGTDALRFVDGDGAGIGNATIRAYLTSEYDAGTLVLRATAVTRDDGRWVAPMYLNEGLTYTLVFEKPGVFAATAEEVEV